MSRTERERRRQIATSKRNRKPRRPTKVLEDLERRKGIKRNF